MSCWYSVQKSKTKHIHTYIHIYARITINTSQHITQSNGDDEVEERGGGGGAEGEEEVVVVQEEEAVPGTYSLTRTQLTGWSVSTADH